MEREEIFKGEMTQKIKERFFWWKFLGDVRQAYKFVNSFNNFINMLPAHWKVSNFQYFFFKLSHFPLDFFSKLYGVGCQVLKLH